MRLQENHGLQNSPWGGGKPYLASGLMCFEKNSVCVCMCVCVGVGGGGGNTIFSTFAVDVDGTDQLPRIEKKAVDRANREPYQ